MQIGLLLLAGGGGHVVIDNDEILGSRLLEVNEVTFNRGSLSSAHVGFGRIDERIGVAIGWIVGSGRHQIDEGERSSSRNVFVAADFHRHAHRPARVVGGPVVAEQEISFKDAIVRRIPLPSLWNGVILLGRSGGVEVDKCVCDGAIAGSGDHSRHG